MVNMKFKILATSIILIFITAACSTGTISKSPVQENRKPDTSIAELQKKYSVLEKENDAKNMSYDNFCTSNGVVIEFIRAYLNKDIEAMKNLVTEDVIIGSNNISFGKKQQPEINYKKDVKAKISYNINGFAYDIESKTMYINIFLEDTQNTKSLGFLKFSLKEIDLVWKIENIEYDV